MNIFTKFLNFIKRIINKITHKEHVQEQENEHIDIQDISVILNVSIEEDKKDVSVIKDISIQDVSVNNVSVIDKPVINDVSIIENISLNDVSAIDNIPVINISINSDSTLNCSV